VWHAGNDGIGSGLDADLLDGNEGSYFATTGGTTNTSFKIDKGQTDEVTLSTGRFTGGKLLLSSNSEVFNVTTSSNSNAALLGNSSEAMLNLNTGDYNYSILDCTSSLVYIDNEGGTSPSDWYTNLLSIDLTNSKTHLDLTAPNSHSIILNVPSGSASTIKVDNHLVWHAGNDGSGSGLDADLLDGNESSYFASAEYAVKYYGSLTSEPATYKPGDEYYDTSSSTLKKYISYDVGWKTITIT
jgi:hypothetical protein